MKTSLILASVATLALTILCFPSSSTAAALCIFPPKEEAGSLVCNAGDKFENATLAGTNEGNVKIVVESGAVECTTGTLKAKLAQVVNAVEGSGGMEFGGVCSTNIPTCKKVKKFTVSNLAATTEALYVQKVAPEGNLVFTQMGLVFELECGGIGVGCVYANKAGDLITGNFYNEAQQLKINTTVTRSIAGPALCSAKATFVANFNVTLSSGQLNGNVVTEGSVYIAKQ